MRHSLVGLAPRLEIGDELIARANDRALRPTHPCRHARSSGFEVEGLRTLAQESKASSSSARGGLYGARRTTLTSDSSLTPIAECGIHKGESGDRGGIGAHHPRPKRNGVDEGLCKEARALLGIEAAFGPDQHGKGCRLQSRQAPRAERPTAPPRRRRSGPAAVPIRSTPCRAARAPRPRARAKCRTARPPRSHWRCRRSTLTRSATVRRVSTGRSTLAPSSVAFCAM